MHRKNERKANFPRVRPTIDRNRFIFLTLFILEWANVFCLFFCSVPWLVRFVRFVRFLLHHRHPTDCSSSLTLWPRGAVLCDRNRNNSSWFVTVVACADRNFTTHITCMDEINGTIVHRKISRTQFGGGETCEYYAFLLLEEIHLRVLFRVVNQPSVLRRLSCESAKLQ